MKILPIILLMLLLSCGQKENDIPIAATSIGDSPTEIMSCDIKTLATLEDLNVGDIILGDNINISYDAEDLFKNMEPIRRCFGPICFNRYIFTQEKDISFGSSKDCFYFAIDVDSDNKIKSILRTRFL